MLGDMIDLYSFRDENDHCGDLNFQLLLKNFSKTNNYYFQTSVNVPIITATLQNCLVALRLMSFITQNYLRHCLHHHCDDNKLIGRSIFYGVFNIPYIRIKLEMYY